MKTRREFFKSAAVLGIVGASPLSLRAAETGHDAPTGPDDRTYWVSILEKLGRPVPANLARRELKLNMPVEERPGSNRKSCTYLEAFGRLLCGIAPWLALENLRPAEQDLHHEFVELAQLSLDAATDPQSPDFMNFTRGGQPLVDVAFLAQGILRAPRCLWKPLDVRVQEQILAALAISKVQMRSSGCCD